ncbi:MAG: precorrin-6A reductase [Tissierellia bacterium]|nr:precorrin-6A reductase [Tissierellia bacterium]
MIWLIGGTQEANLLAHRLEGNIEFILTLATEGGLQFTNVSNVEVGRLNEVEMVEFIKDRDIKGVVDCSHPYAKIVTSLAKSAAKKSNIPYYRYIRPSNHHAKDGIFVKDISECIETLKNITGTVFFTTGSKNIKDFEPLRGKNRFIYRILPTSESFLLAEKAGVKMKDLIGALGPFDEEYNAYLFRKYKVDFCVTKESGAGSGVDEKIVACEKENVTPIVILREAEEGIRDIVTLEKLLVEKYGK